MQEALPGGQWPAYTVKRFAFYRPRVTGVLQPVYFEGVDLQVDDRVARDRGLGLGRGVPNSETRDSTGACALAR